MDERETMLVFERSRTGRRCAHLPELDVPGETGLSEDMLRASALPLPEVAEVDLIRHYVNLSRRTYGVDNGFYPLGSCTMKYNPKLNERVARDPRFADIHPMQQEHTARGCRAVMDHLKTALCAITGMDAMTLQPAAGAHGEYTGLLLIRAYHLSRGDDRRRRILVPDSAHGTNPASAAMAGFDVVSVPSGPDGNVDCGALERICDNTVAALMLTNPNTLGLFEREILRIADIVHGAGGLLYYDGANLNAVMGIVRPGDMGFDAMHLNLHKTFSTPHGGGGPGSGPVGCKEFLRPFLPENTGGVGRVQSFHGNFLVCLKAYAYILSLGGDGLAEASRCAVFNANYLRERLKDVLETPYPGPCMHEFVCSADKIKKQTGVSALDLSKAMIDRGMHPPTMYFPMIVHEALMFEPTETESIETLDRAAEAIGKLCALAFSDAQQLRDAPKSTPVRRVDEVLAARKPVLKYQG